MKRIIGACLEQTLLFETQRDFDTYTRGLDRKRTKYRIDAQSKRSDGMIEVKLVRNHNNYSTNGYLD